MLRWVGCSYAADWKTRRTRERIEATVFQHNQTTPRGKIFSFCSFCMLWEDNHDQLHLHENQDIQEMNIAQLEGNKMIYFFNNC